MRVFGSVVCIQSAILIVCKDSLNFAWGVGIEKTFGSESIRIDSVKRTASVSSGSDEVQAGKIDAWASFGLYGIIAEGVLERSIFEFDFAVAVLKEEECSDICGVGNDVSVEIDENCTIVESSDQERVIEGLVDSLLKDET